MPAATQRGAFVTGKAPNGRFCGRHPEEPPTPGRASGSGPPGSLQGVSRASGPEALEELGGQDPPPPREGSRAPPAVGAGDQAARASPSLCHLHKPRVPTVPATLPAAPCATGTTVSGLDPWNSLHTGLPASSCPHQWPQDLLKLELGSWPSAAQAPRVAPVCLSGIGHAA